MVASPSGLARAYRPNISDLVVGECQAGIGSNIWPFTDIQSIIEIGLVSRIWKQDIE